MFGSKAPGDHAHFFEGDALREGEGCKSLTGTCVTLVPCLVCTVATSNISVVDESQIFGIKRIVWEASKRRMCGTMLHGGN